MRVAQVSPYDLTVPGGVQSHVAALATALRARGDQVHLVGPGLPAGTRPSGSPAHVPVGRSLPVPANGSVAPIALGPGAVARTRRTLQALAPDVVHVHEPMVPVVGWAASRSEVAPVVATFHAWSEDDRLYRAARPLTRRLLAHLDDTLAVSAAAAGFHAAALGIDVERFHVVPNGVDTARFRAAADAREREGEGTAETVLFVGRLEPRKGLAVLLEAVARLADRRPQLHLEVIGDGPEGARCRAAVPDRLRGRVHYLGRVSDAELTARLAACDLYVSPALGGESFGIVLLEAMAAGRALVASDIPGYRSVVEDGVHGRLVPPGDGEALAAAIDEVLDAPHLRAAFHAAGREQADRHDWMRVADRLRERYTRVVHQRG